MIELLEQFNAPIQLESESTLSADDIERLESAKKKRARKEEYNRSLLIENLKKEENNY